VCDWYRVHSLSARNVRRPTRRAIDSPLTASLRQSIADRTSARRSTNRNSARNARSRNQQLGAAYDPYNQTNDDQRANDSVSKHLNLQLLLKITRSLKRVLFRLEHLRAFNGRLFFVENTAKNRAFYSKTAVVAANDPKRANCPMNTSFLERGADTNTARRHAIKRSGKACSERSTGGFRQLVLPVE
jgi:hypothetical protein